MNKAKPIWKYSGQTKHKDVFMKSEIVKDDNTVEHR